jgi:hypothetical protein
LREQVLEYCSNLPESYKLNEGNNFMPKLEAANIITKELLEDENIAFKNNGFKTDYIYNRRTILKFAFGKITDESAQELKNIVEDRADDLKGKQVQVD